MVLVHVPDPKRSNWEETSVFTSTCSQWFLQVFHEPRSKLEQDTRPRDLETGATLYELVTFVTEASEGHLEGPKNGFHLARPTRQTRPTRLTSRGRGLTVAWASPI